MPMHWVEGTVQSRHYLCISACGVTESKVAKRKEDVTCKRCLWLLQRYKGPLCVKCKQWALQIRAKVFVEEIAHKGMCINSQFWGYLCEGCYTEIF